MQRQAPVRRALTVTALLRSQSPLLFHSKMFNDDSCDFRDGRERTSPPKPDYYYYFLIGGQHAVTAAGRPLLPRSFARCEGAGTNGDARAPTGTEATPASGRCAAVLPGPRRRLPGSAAPTRGGAGFQARPDAPAGSKVQRAPFHADLCMEDVGGGSTVRCMRTRGHEG